MVVYVTDDGLDADVPDWQVQAMVATVEPDWDVTTVSRFEAGTEFVAELDVALTNSAGIHRECIGRLRPTPRWRIHGIDRH